MEKEEAYCIPNDGYEEEFSDEEDEVTYEDICQSVENGERRGSIQKKLLEYEATKYDNIDTLDSMTDDLWYNVVVPYLETFGLIDKNNLAFRHAFYKWLYDNSNIGRQLDYIFKLEKALISKSKGVGMN